MPETVSTAPTPLTFRQVLRGDVIRRVWYAQIVSLFGDFLALFAVIAVVSFRMHGTPNQLTGVQIAYMLPLVILGPLAGVFVDRWPLKPTLIASDLLRALLALLLIATTSIWQVYVVLALLSSVSSFFGPAQSVTIRTHVPNEGLISANALMQIAFMGSRIVGPATAGAMVAAFGPASCYAVDVLSFLVSASLIGSVVIRRPRAAAAPAESSGNRIHAIWADMGQGMTFILHHAAVLFVVLAMAAGLFTIGCFGPLIAIYVRDTLHAAARLFGFVSGMIGVGLLAGTLGIRALARHVKNDTLVLSGLAGIGAGVLLLGAVPLIAATLAGAFVIGFAFAAIIVPAQTLMQQETPHAMLGRVSSTVTSVVFLAQIGGLILSGIFAELIGIRAVFFLCAGIAGALMTGGKMLLHASAAPLSAADAPR
ncbi:MAG TPA: MFS transporter [Vicinamibacterales bacterium]|nr:MFS transporter [Vicinamibacterales bacterium]